MVAGRAGLLRDGAAGEGWRESGAFVARVDAGGPDVRKGRGLDRARWAWQGPAEGPGDVLHLILAGDAGPGPRTAPGESGGARRINSPPINPTELIRRTAGGINPTELPGTAPGTASFGTSSAPPGMKLQRRRPRVGGSPTAPGTPFLLRPSSDQTTGRPSATPARGAVPGEAKGDERLVPAGPRREAENRREGLEGLGFGISPQTFVSPGFRAFSRPEWAGSGVKGGVSGLD